MTARLVPGKGQGNGQSLRSLFAAEAAEPEAGPQCEMQHMQGSRGLGAAAAMEQQDSDDRIILPPDQVFNMYEGLTDEEIEELEAWRADVERRRAEGLWPFGNHHPDPWAQAWAEAEAASKGKGKGSS